MPKLEFFFDLTSPWTYLAFSQVEPLCAQTGAELVWRPILVGGVFNAVNPDLYAARDRALALARGSDSAGAAPVPGAARARYTQKDLADWARLYGLRIQMPSSHPARAVELMRGAYLALDRSRISEYSRAAFEVYFGDGLDVSKADVLRQIATRAGLDEERFIEELAQPGPKARLRQTTDELIRRGGFGSPTLFVDTDDMFFGNDRLPLVRAALERA